MGLMLGLDALVSRAFGAGDLEACHRWLVHGVTLALVVSLPFMLVLFQIGGALEGWGLAPSVLALTRPYLDALTWSVPPLLLYSAFRRYLQGMGVVKPIMIALAAANVVNLVVNWILIYGHVGAPAHGRARLGLGDGAGADDDGALLLVVIVVARARPPARVCSRRRCEWRRR